MNPEQKKNKPVRVTVYIDQEDYKTLRMYLLGKERTFSHWVREKIKEAITTEVV